MSQSYSKNLGLYAERIGAISCVCADKETAEKCAPLRVHACAVHRLVPCV